MGKQSVEGEGSRRFVCLDGGEEAEQEIRLAPGLTFSAHDRLEFLRAAEEMRKAALKPGLSSGGQLALRFLSQQARRLAGPGRG